MKSNLQVAILDDEATHLNFAIEILKDIPYVQSINGFNKPNELFTFLESSPVDVILLDIDLPTTTGINVAETIFARYPKIKIIFVSAHTKYAVESFKVYPVDYIVKPIDYSRLERSLKKIKGDFPSHVFNTKIGIKVNSNLKLITLKDIIFIEKSGRKSIIYLNEGNPVESYESISQLEKKVAVANFFRCHQSYLVSVDHITEVLPDEFANSYNLKLKSISQLIKVSKHKYKELKLMLENTV